MKDRQTDEALEAIQGLMNRASVAPESVPGPGDGGVEDALSIEEAIADARARGLYAEPEDTLKLVEQLHDATLTAFRLAGTVGSKLVELGPRERMRLTQAGAAIRQLGYAVEGALRHIYGAGGLGALREDMQEHRGLARAIVEEEGCTCDACLIARAGGRETRGHGPIEAPPAAAEGEGGA